MSSDSLNTAPEENARPIFAETRASTLIPRTPAAPDTQKPSPVPDEPQGSQEIVSASTPVPSQEFVATQSPPENDETAPKPTETASVQPQVSLEASLTLDAAVSNATDPALALNFVPAPEAPFQSSVTVGIACKAHDARIFYTLDGTAPDQTSTLYSPEKILLTQSAMLSARAFTNGKSGPICSASYVVSKPLWQENEPADPADSTPHKISENLKVHDSWQISAASVRGKLHAHRALWREDAFALGNVGAWSICIVSDGAGSAPLSRVGANLACQTALGDLMKNLGEIEILGDEINADLPRIKSALVGGARAALQATRDEADARSQPVNAFAATLLILVRRAVGEAQLCAALQVGDGAIALDCTSGLKMLGAADHGQHSSETRFLTTNGMEEDFANRVKFSLPTDLRAMLVVSDGVSDDYFPEDKRLTEVFESVTPLARSADDAGTALLNWLGYEKKGSSDDRTLVLSWPRQLSATDDLEAESAATPQLSAEQADQDVAKIEPASEFGSSAIAPVAPRIADDADTASGSNSTETRDGV